MDTNMPLKERRKQQCSSSVQAPLTAMNTSKWEFTTTNQPPHTALPFAAAEDYLHVAIFSSITLLLLLVLLLFFSIRKWRHATHHPPSTTTTSLPPAAAHHRSLGLGEEAIDSLPVSLHQSFNLSSNTTDEDTTECCICLDVFEDQERIKVLPGCQHTYHSDCVDLWLGNQSSCPLCRVSLKNLGPLAPPNNV